ncbi:M48 family metalloprotease, partial [Klebsiella michiganensis]|uniref:M48 family metalloprotease n=1 Tax=Klebsiella michiganensis TaxID=1134687 RepID=UPI0013D29572
NELIGVMAHETGHIAGGHLARLREAVERAQIVAVIGMLVGAGAVAAGAAGGRAGSSVGEAAPGVLMG